MSETRTVHDPFRAEDVQVSNRLVDRLRGKYANGPTMANGEPEFGWREFPTPPIQHEAADEIEGLRLEYTTDIRGAGLYSKEEAVSISAASRDGWRDPGSLPCELAIPLTALPENIRAAVRSSAMGSSQ